MNPVLLPPFDGQEEGEVEDELSFDYGVGLELKSLPFALLLLLQFVIVPRQVGSV